MSAGRPVPLSQVRGDALEIKASFDTGTSKRCGLMVRADGQGGGLKVWVRADNVFGIEGCGNKPCLKKEARVVLRIFVDRGVLEVYCGGAAVTQKCFAPEDQVAVFAFSEDGNATLESMEAWKMKSMWE